LGYIGFCLTKVGVGPVACCDVLTHTLTHTSVTYLLTLSESCSPTPMYVNTIQIPGACDLYSACDIKSALALTRCVHWLYAALYICVDEGRT
jgi:hypothetical protein